MNYLIQFRVERKKEVSLREKNSNRKVIHLPCLLSSLQYLWMQCAIVSERICLQSTAFELRKNVLLTWTWNNVIESSSICTRTANFFPPPREWWDVDVDPSTPDGVLNECVIRLFGCPLEAPSEFRDIALLFSISDFPQRRQTLLHNFNVHKVLHSMSTFIIFSQHSTTTTFLIHVGYLLINLADSYLWKSNFINT